MEPGCVSERVTPAPASKFPCEPGWKTGSSGDWRSTWLTMHAGPFRIEEMVADDLDRTEALAQRIGDKGACAMQRTAALDQRQRDIFAEHRRIAAGGDMADGAVRVFFVQFLDDVRTAIEWPVVQRDDADELQALGGDQPLAVHHCRTDERLFLRQHPVQMQVARRGA